MIVFVKGIGVIDGDGFEYYEEGFVVGNELGEEVGLD